MKLSLRRRCTAKLPPGSAGAGPYYGRCDHARGHLGPHWLERGMDEIHFTILVVRARTGSERGIAG